MLIALPIIMGGILLLRSWLVPLTGPDLCNRWDQLARDILRLGHYHFYPPRSAQDFQHYGFAESLPPMLTSALWWIYASIGQAAPRATAVFVVLQYAVLMGFVYRLTRRIGSSLAAAMATAILTAAPLTFFSLVIGEEAGLVAIGALAMLYFIFPEPNNLSADNGWRSALLAGAAAAFAPLSREFALGYLAMGLILAISLRRDVPWLFFFSLTAAALTFPWYARTWALTGNPLYSLPVFGLFPTNPIVAAQYQIARQTRSIWIMPFFAWRNLLSMLLQLAPLQLIFLIPLVIAFLRRQRSMLAAWIVFTALWLLSIGLTDSLWYWSRMLLPAAAVLSILLAIGATQLLHRWQATSIVVFALLLLCWCYSAVFGLIYPRRLEDTPPRDWIASSLAIDPPLWQKPVIDANLAAHLSPGQRILSANLYAWSAQLHSANQVVPLWSPEVRFIFDSRLPLAEIYQRLHQLDIGAVLMSQNDLHRYPANPLYSQASKHWLLVTPVGPDDLYHLPPR